MDDLGGWVDDLVGGWVIGWLKCSIFVQWLLKILVLRTSLIPEMSTLCQC